MKETKSSREMMIASGQSMVEREYWLNQFSQQFEKSSFHYDYQPAGTGESQPDVVRIKLTGEIFSKAVKLSGGSDTKLFMILVAGLTGLLYKYTGSNDIILGAPIYKQDVEGEFINTVLPLRNQLDSLTTFKELLPRVRQVIINGYNNQNYPMNALLQELKIPVTPGDFPLFDVAVLLENIHDKKYIRYTNPAMYFSFLQGGDHLELLLEYNSLLYSKTTAERIAAHYIHFLGQALSHIDLPISRLDIMPEEEKQEVLVTFNRTGAEHLAGFKDKTIQQLFEEQVELTPDYTAVKVWGSEKSGNGESGELTYRALNEKANRLGWRLREQGVKPDTIVCLMKEPSLEMISGLLAILKAGGAYLPIDTTVPPRRIQTVLKDSAVDFLITGRHLADKINFNKKMIDPADQALYTGRGKSSNPAIINTSTDLAYVIYTSGSTGTPQGVLIRHGNILNYVYWRLKAYKQTAQDVCLQMLSISFDGFCANLYPAILSGGKIVMLSENKMRDIDYIGKVIAKEKITTFSLTPLFYKAILEGVKNNNLKGVKFVILGGEQADKNTIQLSRETAPHITLINEYGPTENSVTTTANLGMTPGNAAVVGKPVANNHVFIPDENLQPKPIGVIGELWVSGEGLARGYLNNPELTVEKFDHDLWDYRDEKKNHKLQITKKPAHQLHEKNNKKFLRGGPGGALFIKSAPPGRRRQNLYKTGDFGRWLPGGNIELAGRRDDQLKIRGHRIELREIEACILSHPCIKEAAVTAVEGKILWGFYTVTAAGAVLSVTEISAYLTERLPDYMVPAYFSRLEKIPWTSTGKIDRRALIKLAESRKKEIKFVEPRNETEKKLAQMWSEILKKDKIGIHDNFFNIGGDSIKILNLATLINREFDTSFKVEILYENETIEKIAGKIAENNVVDTEEDYSDVEKQIDDLKNKFLQGVRDNGK